MRVLVTGARGFVGRRLTADLAADGRRVRAAVRGAGGRVPGAADTWSGDLEEVRDLASAVNGVDAVVHLAARVHHMRDSLDAWAAYRAANVDATIRLAQAARDAGVKRFVFLSSVKVNGERTETTFTETDAPAPMDPYGVSKAEAETALRDLAGGGMDIVTIRPPLVYGPGVKANFLALLRLADTCLPVPLGAARTNPRSMIFVGNLTSAIAAALSHPDAGGRTFLVRDGEDVSPADLLRRLRHAFNRAPGLLSAPRPVIAAAATLAGRPNAAGRLFDSLQVSDSLIRRRLDWSPPYSLDHGLVATAAWYCAARAREGLAA